MKIGVLTSSRADYGIYFPLLKKLKADPSYELDLLVFGTHLSEKFGRTVGQIEQDGFTDNIHIETLPKGELPGDIAESMARTITGFSMIWKARKYDLVFALGDRYEMFAAVASTVPFNIPVAHLHGGETTLGVIDNVFRHSISCMSKLHFTAAEEYKQRVIEITGSKNKVYNVGALSIDSLKSLKLFSIKEFKEKYGIDLSIPTVLVTFHPETVNTGQNEQFVHELTGSLKKIRGYQYVITMPNADPMGLTVRKGIQAFIEGSSNAIGIESFGSLGYLSCMKHCKLMLGNTSSGFIEASFFPKIVINLGERQKGRIRSQNIIDCDIRQDSIIDAIHKAELMNLRKPASIYGTGNTASRILTILKKNL
jgi:GDP/UDP-N,N'-diacetylbacillosamine 2-epimerase (hydrolysing)